MFFIEMNNLVLFLLVYIFLFYLFGTCLSYCSNEFAYKFIGAMIIIAFLGQNIFVVFKLL